MKPHVFMIIGSVLVLITLKPVACRAQAEVDPDHYNATGIDPITLPRNPTRDFQGSFTLPFDVRCAGLTLSPGAYSFSIHVVEKGDALALITKGGGAQIQARMKLQSRTGGPNALLIEGRDRERRLKAISLEKPGIMLYLEAEQPRNLSENPELVPISVTVRDRSAH